MHTQLMQIQITDTGTDIDTHTDTDAAADTDTDRSSNCQGALLGYFFTYFGADLVYWVGFGPAMAFKTQLKF